MFVRIKLCNWGFERRRFIDGSCAVMNVQSIAACPSCVDGSASLFAGVKKLASGNAKSISSLFLNKDKNERGIPRSGLLQPFDADVCTPEIRVIRHRGAPCYDFEVQGVSAFELDGVSHGGVILFRDLFYKLQRTRSMCISLIYNSALPWCYHESV